jgi:hypothetical protein
VLSKNSSVSADAVTSKQRSDVAVDTLADIDQLGLFGVRHADANDHAALYTAMHTMLRHASKVDQQYFFIFELGLKWELHDHVSIAFSGLYQHVGNVPIYKSTADPTIDKFLRFTAIAYGPTAQYLAKSSRAWAAGAKKALKTKPSETNSIGYGHFI